MLKKELSLSEIEDELLKIYSSKRADKSSYSISTLARSLQINDSTLRKIIRKERKLGRLIAEKIAQKWNLSLKEEKRERKNKNNFKLSLSHPLLALYILIRLNLEVSIQDLESECEELGYDKKAFSKTILEIQKITQKNKMTHPIRLNVYDSKRQSAAVLNIIRILSTDS